MTLSVCMLLKAAEAAAISTIPFARASVYIIVAG